MKPLVTSFGQPASLTRQMDHYRAVVATALTCQILPPASSPTSNEPSGATVTPAGLPHLEFALASTTKPDRKSSMGPGLPFVKGTKITFAPSAVDLFHEPCSPTNAPLR